MGQGVSVAGIGVITAMGNSVEECLSSFQKSKEGIQEIAYLNTVHQQRFPVAEVKFSNQQLAELAGLPSTLPRIVLLSTIAAKEALNNAGIHNMKAWRTGFISANTIGGMDKTESFYEGILSGTTNGKLQEVVHHECGSATEIVADILGIKNHISTISTACSSSANAIFSGARLIKNNVLDIVVAGGVDALTKFTLNGFNTLMILDEEYCKPFDENRKGLNLGEGAGYVVLVSDKVAAALNHKPYCQLSGYCNANDAYHQTASSPDGTGSYLAMTGAMEQSGIKPEDIDYINLHGTGTQNNDNSEGTAITRIFKHNYPRMSSTKSFTGHTLGASGSIEAVFSTLAIRDGLVYPNLRFSTPIKDLNIIPQTSFLSGENIQHVLSNSFGFGGNCTSLVFSKI